MPERPHSPFRLASNVSGVIWPAVPTPEVALQWALLEQLEQSQWWSTADLEAYQFAQLKLSVAHAYQTVPFYRRRFDEAGLTPDVVATPEGWRRLPILVRRDLQTQAESLVSTQIPRDHGPTSVRSTGGSTGEPVRVMGTGITGFAWRVYTLRDHLWHGRDFRAKLAVIRFVESERARPPHGSQSRNWGISTRAIDTGPCAVLTIHTTTAEQAEWLVQQDAEYFLSYPSAILALARYCQKHGLHLPRLREVRTFGEVVEPQVREAVRAAWGVRVVDAYSSEEFGYIALECPQHEHYHIQSENVLVEVLDDEGRPCRPGEVGKVIISTLHNFAMPLLRYDVGDYAEVGEPCPCGRGLPVLRRILGRQRNMFTLPTGETRWPMISAQDIASAFEDLPPISKFQLVQKTLERIVINMVVSRPLTPTELETVRHYVQRGLGYPFDVEVCYVDDIPRSPRGKFEEYRSEVASG